MAKSRLVYFLVCLTLVFTLSIGFLATQVTLFAADGTPTPTPSPTPSPEPPRLTLKCDIPSYSDNSGTSFSYDITLEYTGTNRITVSLANTQVQGWGTLIQYLGKQINSIDIGPAQYGSASATISLTLSPESGKLPLPGDYSVTLKATSGSFNPSIDLKATVKAKYSYIMTAETGRLSISATAGQENHYSLVLTNTSSEALKNLAFNSTKPENWIVTFKPEKIDSLGVNQTQQVDVVITPPSGKTIAGDYMLTLRSNNEQVNSSMDVRVTALTPSIWGYVGIIIVVVVIAGIVVLFMKLGRR
jgi:uncharacterized membrane protein